MCKKLAMTAVVALAAVGILNFTKAGSYVSVLWNKASNSVSSQVPIEFEIERLKVELTKLTPDLRKNIAILAEEKAGVDKMEREIKTTQVNLDRQKARCLEMAKWIDGGETHFISEGKVFNRDQVAERMDRDWKACKRTESELKNREQVLMHKKKLVDSAEEQLRAMQDKEQELRTTIAALEAELKAVRVAQTQSQFQLDDTRLGDIKESIQKLQDRVNAERYKAELEGQYIGGNNSTATVDKPTPRPTKDLAKEIRQSLENGTSVSNEK